MADETRNRFNIPLNAAGAMANVMKWPWYWRYPMGLVGTVVCLWLTIEWMDASPGNKWAVLLVGGGATLACAFLMYELLLVGAFLGFVYGFVKLVSVFLPASPRLGWLPSLMVGGGIYAVFLLYQLTVKVEELTVKVETLRQSSESLDTKFDALLSHVRWQDERRSREFSQAWRAGYDEPNGDEGGT